MQELEEVARSYKKVAIHVPEGLIPRVREIIDFLEDKGVEVITILDPLYGACDLRIEEAKSAGAEALITFGHAKMLETDFPVHYIEWKKQIDVEGLREVLKEIPWSRFNLCATVQYSWVLEGLDKRARIGKGKRAIYPGQVLGCDVTACDPTLPTVFIGDGRFHPLGIYLYTKKPVIKIGPDLEPEDLTEEGEKLLRERYRLMAAALSCEEFLVVSCSKLGQRRPGVTREVVNFLREKGKKVYLAVVDYLRPEYVQGYPGECIVFTGCPRLSIEDWRRFKKPVLTPKEVFAAFRGEEYEFDNWFFRQL